MWGAGVIRTGLGLAAARQAADNPFGIAHCELMVLGQVVEPPRLGEYTVDQRLRHVMNAEKIKSRGFRFRRDGRHGDGYRARRALILSAKLRELQARHREIGEEVFEEGGKGPSGGCAAINVKIGAHDHNAPASRLHEGGEAIVEVD